VSARPCKISNVKVFHMKFPNPLKNAPGWLGILGTRQFWSFFGTGVIVSVAYIDPGNWGTSISAGATFNYSLLWVIWLSSAMAMLFQYMSGKLGIAGYSLTELIRLRWKNRYHVLAYWCLAEIAILATDLAEFLGIAVALNLLFGVPLAIGAIIALFDVLLLLFLTRKSFRSLEYAFIFFVSAIGLGYVYELFITGPSLGPMIAGSIAPSLAPGMMFLIVGIIGAVVMPHALFVHSWLMKNKARQLGRTIDGKTALEYHTIDTVFSLFIAALINAAILIMAAAAFYSTGIPVATLEEAYRTLTPLFGPIASIVFATALLFAGISSSITGTLAGQGIMDSLTDFKVSPTVRRLVTRVINLVPLLVAIGLNIEPLQILVYSQVALSLLIPLPLIPLIYYTSKKEVMRGFVNRKITTIAASAFGLIIIALNVYLLWQFFFPA